MFIILFSRLTGSRSTWSIITWHIIYIAKIKPPKSLKSYTKVYAFRSFVTISRDKLINILMCDLYLTQLNDNGGAGAISTKSFSVFVPNMFKIELSFREILFLWTKKLASCVISALPVKKYCLAVFLITLLTSLNMVDWYS